jgi:hypothetical protein
MTRGARRIVVLAALVSGAMCGALVVNAAELARARAAEVAER